MLPKKIITKGIYEHRTRDAALEAENKNDLPKEASMIKR